MLAVTFKNALDYEKVREDDKISVTGLSYFETGKPLRMVLTHSDGTGESFEVAHSYTHEQIEWFKAGSALNRLRGRETKFAVPSASV
jgi:aconitate hydratase